MNTLKVIKIGDSLGVLLPLEVLARLQVGGGDTVYLSDSPEGYCMTAANQELAEQLAEGRRDYAR